MQSLSHPPMIPCQLRRIAIVFSGGPAPAANAVISTAAAAFLRYGIEVIGILNGYAGLAQCTEENPPEEGRDYCFINHEALRRTRNSQGVLLRTAREHPGRMIRNLSDLYDPQRTSGLHRVYRALCCLKVDALLSIGGDGTLITANLLKLLQTRMPAGYHHIRIIHLPKTIDNDYMGIDFTFGYFTAVDTLAVEIRNLLADAEATSSYYVVTTMGRSAGWLAYGAAIASEASLVIGAEDITDRFQSHESIPNSGGSSTDTRVIMNMDAVVGRIVETMRAREREGKTFGVIVLSEGLTEYLPGEFLKETARDDFGNISLSQVNLAGIFAHLVNAEYRRQTGRQRKSVGIRLGYESRCAKPHAYDVVLASQIGVGAYRALVEEEMDGVMVSVTGQVELKYIPFEELVDQKSLKTIVRRMSPGSDFHRLARFLETYVPESQ
ncbi:MAG: 6-phosphofructokinase [Desulfobacteraceae bacterium]